MRISNYELAMITIAFDGKLSLRSGTIRFLKENLPEWFYKVFRNTGDITGYYEEIFNDPIYYTETSDDAVLICAGNEFTYVDISQVDKLISYVENRVYLYNNRWLLPSKLVMTITRSDYFRFICLFCEKVDLKYAKEESISTSLDDMRLFLALNFLMGWVGLRYHEEDGMTMLEYSYHELQTPIQLYDLRVSNFIKILPHWSESESGVFYVQVPTINLSMMLIAWYAYYSKKYQLTIYNVIKKACADFPHPLKKLIQNAAHRLFVRYPLPEIKNTIESVDDFLNNLFNLDSLLNIGLFKDVCRDDIHIFVPKFSHENFRNASDDIYDIIEDLVFQSMYFYADIHGNICVSKYHFHEAKNVYRGLKKQIQEYKNEECFYDRRIRRIIDIVLDHGNNILEVYKRFDKPHGFVNPEDMDRLFQDYCLGHIHVISKQDDRNSRIIDDIEHFYEKCKEAIVMHDGMQPNNRNLPTVIVGMINYLNVVSDTQTDVDCEELQCKLLSFKQNLPIVKGVSNNKSNTSISTNDSLIIVCAALNPRAYEKYEVVQYFATHLSNKICDDGLSVLEDLLNKDFKEIYMILKSEINRRFEDIPTQIKLLAFDKLKDMLISQYKNLNANKKFFKDIANLLNDYLLASHKDFHMEYFTNEKIDNDVVIKLVGYAYNTSCISFDDFVKMIIFNTRTRLSPTQFTLEVSKMLSTSLK